MTDFQNFCVSITSNRSALFKTSHCFTSYTKLNLEEFQILTPYPKETPAHFILREAEYNAQNIFDRKKIDLGISISVIAACGKRIIRAFCDNYSSFERLNLLSGRRHYLLSCVSIIFKKENQTIVTSKLAKTKIKIKCLTANEKTLILSREENIVFYLDSFLNSAFIHWVEGSYSNLNGSYESELYNILQSKNLLHLF